MNRLTYTVRSIRGGWHLDEDGEVLQWFYYANEAQEAACNLAAWLFEVRGIPTSVMLSANERLSLVAQYG